MQTRNGGRTCLSGSLSAFSDPVVQDKGLANGKVSKVIEGDGVLEQEGQGQGLLGQGLLGQGLLGQGQGVLVQCLSLL